MEKQAFTATTVLFHLAENSFFHTNGKRFSTCTAFLNYLRVHEKPFPTNPCLHSQVPLTHFAFTSQRSHLSTDGSNKRCYSVSCKKDEGEGRVAVGGGGGRFEAWAGFLTSCRLLGCSLVFCYDNVLRETLSLHFPRISPHPKCLLMLHRCSF